MGAAEYENGVLPHTLMYISQNASKYAKYKYKDVFFVCIGEHLEELKECIKKAVKDKLLVKNNADYNNPKVRGWIDIKRHAFIFKDEDTCDKACKPFKIKGKDADGE